MIELLSSLVLLSGDAKIVGKDVLPIPFSNRPVGGRLFGSSFIPDQVILKKLGESTMSSGGKVSDRGQSYQLIFRTGKDFYADQEVQIWFTLDPKEPVSNLKLTRLPKRASEQPWEIFNYKGKKRSIGMGITTIFADSSKPKSMNTSYSFEFGCKLHFGATKSNQMPGKIILSLPDRAGAIEGNFNAKIEK